MIKYITLLIAILTLTGCSQQLGKTLPVVELSTTEKISKDGIEKVLKDKTTKEKIKIKSVELSKVKLGKYTKDKLKIEIIGDIKEIEGGIELFAKAWKDGKQLGFGKDGTVEIERFRFFNPPVLVDDENGDIIREWTIEDEDTKEIITKYRKLKYDPDEVIKQILKETILLVGKDGKNIIVGKVGNTTSTFYSTTDDGYVRSNNYSWSTLRAGSGVIGSKTGESGDDFHCSDWYSDIAVFRFHGVFETSALGGDTIDSATLSTYWSSLAVGNFTSHNGWQATVSSLAGANVDAWWDSYTSALSACSNEVRLGTTAGYIDFPLTATGLTKIEKSSDTYMGITSYWDIVNTDPNQSGGVKNDHGRLYFADYDGAGTTSDPKLVVEHSAGVSRRIIQVE